MQRAALGRDEIESAIREILTERGQVPLDARAIDSTQSLYDAGLTSHATVKVMLAIEDHFDIEFPDELLQRSVFDRIANITEAVVKLYHDR